MFKKITFLLMMVSALNARAQFTIDDDTLYTYGFAGTQSTDFVDLWAHTVIRSTNASPETILWNRINNNLPDVNWGSAICDIISCRTPEVSLDSFTFANGGDTGVLSFHFYTKNINGEAWMTVRFSRASNPMEFKDVVINCKAWKPVGITTPGLKSLNIYPNPASNLIKIDNREIGNASLKVYNSLGQIVMELPFLETISLDIAGLNSGIYTVKIEGVNGIAVSTFIKS